MKKNIIYLLISLLFFSNNIFAQDTQQLSPEDSYTTEETISTEQKQSSSKFSIKDFLFGKSKYLEYDTTPLSTGTLIGTLSPKDAKLLYDSSRDLVGIQTAYETNTCVVLLDNVARKAIQNAASAYINDFESKRLIRKPGKTRVLYGKYKAKIEWGTLSFMLTGSGDTLIKLGYEFKKNSPWFEIIVNATENTKKDKMTYTSQKSVEMHLYFTKSQILALSDLISEENLSALNEALIFQESSPDQY